MVRLKNRYTLVRVHWGEAGPPAPSKKTGGRGVEGGAVYAAIKGAIRGKVGEEGLEVLGPSLTVMYYSALTNLAVVRVTRNHVHVLHTALRSVTEIVTCACSLETLHVAGSVRTAQRAALQHHDTLARPHAQDPALQTALAKEREALLEKTYHES
jgi:ribonuclease P/MRP protein subunit POP5